MRIIGGEFRSRRIRSLPGLEVRPTPDRLREALFNILAPRIEGTTFVDAYAGCGSVGLEAISRGASRVVFIDRKRAAAEVIRQNLQSLGITKGYEIRVGKAAGLLDRVTGDIVFLDPPYELEREYADALRTLGVNPPALAIVQHSTRRSLNESYGGLGRVRVVRQGDNELSFYERQEEKPNQNPG